MENKNSIPQIIFHRYTANVRLAVLFIVVLLSQFGPTPALASSSLIGQETTIISRVNSVRAEAGLQALTIDSRLTQSAQAKATDMASMGYFAHGSPEGYRMGHWINGAGYTYSLAGENLAKGFTSIDRLMNAWVASPSHYQNLIEPKFVNIGIGIAEGVYQDQPTVFVVQHFGVEATGFIKDTAPIVAVVAPAIESVAGANDLKTFINSGVPAPIQVKPSTVSSATKSPTAPLELIQVVQASPLTNTPVLPANSPLQFWPIFALTALALIGYLDEYLPLWAVARLKI